MKTTIKEMLELQLTGTDFSAASNHQVKAIHDLKAWLFYGWAARKLAEIKGGR